MTQQNETPEAGGTNPATETKPSQPEQPRREAAEQQPPETAETGGPPPPPEPQSRPEPTPEPVVEPVVVVKAKSGRGLAAFALLIALAALAGSGWLYWQSQQVQPVVNGPDYLALIESQGQRQASAMNSALSSQLAALRDELARQQGSLEGEIERLRTEAQSESERLRSESKSAIERLRSEDQSASSGAQAAVREELNQQISGLQADLSSLQGEIEQLRSDRGGVDQNVTALQESSRRTAAAVERRLASLEAGIGALTAARTDKADDLVLAETEFLLRAAADRLQLFNDPAGALRALDQAANRLATTDDPAYMTVRQTLASHQQALKSLDLPDRVALSGQLLALARDSVRWPLDSRRTLSASGANLLVPDESEQGLWPRMKSVLSSVVVVHREKDTATAALLTLEEERLLRENVRLQLQVAQLAAVRAEQPLYDSALATVQEWMNEFYDPEQPAISTALKQVESLAGIRLSPPLPEIGGALRQLRSLRAAGQQADQAEAQG